MSAIITKRKTAIVLLSIGTFTTGLSYILNSTVIAFIGLTFLLWGIIFSFIIPKSHVRSDIMESISLSNLLSLDMAISESSVQGTALYMPFPKELYLPYEIGIRNEFIYIPKKDDEIDGVVDQAYSRRPSGLRLIPPGYPLADLLQKQCEMTTTEVSIDSLSEILPSAMSEMKLANKPKISVDNDSILLSITGSEYETLCGKVNGLKHICPHIGCPISSSVACILTRLTKKPVMIEKCSFNTKMIQVLFRILKN